MKQILLFLSLVLFQTALSAQVKTAGVNYSVGAPAWTPSVNTGSELAIDTVSKRIYLWNRNTGAWDMQGRGVDQTSGATPPAYTPGQTDSYLAINNATPPELYAWTGSAWAKVGGTIQTIDTFSVSGSVVSLSLSGDNQPAKTITLPASGITALTGDVTASGPGSAAATIAIGAVTGAKLASGAVSDSTKMGANVIEQSNIDNGAVWARHIARMGASTGQVLGWNGSVWGPTAAGVSGSGSSGQVAYWTGANTQSGSNNLFWDAANGRMGIGTTTPSGQISAVGFVKTSAATNEGVMSLTGFNHTALTGSIHNMIGLNIDGTHTFTGANQIGTGLRINIASNATTSHVVRPLDFNYSGNLQTVSTIMNTSTGSSASADLFLGTGTGSNQSYFQLTSGNSANAFNARGLVFADLLNTNYWGIGTVNSNQLGFFHTDASASVGSVNPTMFIRNDRVAIGRQSINNVIDATLHIRGSGITSATITADFQNSAGTTALRVRDDLKVAVADGVIMGPISGFGGIFNNTSASGKGIIIRGNYSPSETGDDIVIDNAQGDPTHTSGIRNLTVFKRGFAPTSGTGGMRWAFVNPTVNQTGGASGATIGFLAAPTLTSAASWRSFEYRNDSGWGIYGVGTANNYIAGNTTIGSTNTPTDRLDITGANGYSQLRLRTAYTPTSTADANGNTGDISWDENYFYVKTAAGWKRSALTTF